VNFEHAIDVCTNTQTVTLEFIKHYAMCKIWWYAIK